ncbi:Amino acid transporter transmembrane domain [Arabidopsis suecica]|uniref:Amino acid transporter transmembrane domain n=1 Tax=Arabidopsis suecica TaxID=45249 RepID=A0A8T1ZAB5_ARASU|nr:Amino acid transporter transmembrane domain [Arabidopsis suecica]
MSRTMICVACVEENKGCECEHEKPVKELVLEASENSSFLHSVINMVGMLIGLGQLSMPYAVESGGWMSIFLLIFFGILTTYTSHILGNCIRRNPKSKSYSDIGYSAFGSHGRLITSLFIYLEIFMALVSYTISLHDNISAAFPATFSNHGHFPAAKLTAVAVAIALPSLWIRDLSSISFLSSGGILMSAIIFGSVVYTAVFGGVTDDGRIPVLRLGNIPTVSGIYLFSFGGHIVFPNLYTSMKDPSKFTKVSIVSFATVTALYTALAMTGAKMFGPSVNSQITLSLPKHLLVTKIALWATVLTPMTKYALEFAPLAIQLERSLPSTMTDRTKLVARGLMGSSLLLVILALALTVPYFGYVLSLSGSLVSVTIAVTLPAAFYLKICWDGMSKFTRVANLGFVILGCVLGVLGSFESSKLLVKELIRVHGG